jgi:hypothetical protein
MSPTLPRFTSLSGSLESLQGLTTPGSSPLDRGFLFGCAGKTPRSKGEAQLPSPIPFPGRGF